MTAFLHQLIKSNENISLIKWNCRHQHLTNSLNSALSSVKKKLLKICIPNECVLCVSSLRLAFSHLSLHRCVFVHTHQEVTRNRKQKFIFFFRLIKCFFYVCINCIFRHQNHETFRFRFSRIITSTTQNVNVNENNVTVGSDCHFHLDLYELFFSRFATPQY